MEYHARATTSGLTTILLTVLFARHHILEQNVQSVSAIFAR